MNRIRLHLGAATLSLLALSHSAAAQSDSACTPERCALAVRQTLFGYSITEGIDHRRVASIRFFAPALSTFDEPSGRAARSYRTFQAQHNQGQMMMLFGVLISNAAILGALDGREIGNIGLRAGVVAVVVGAIRVRLAPNSLFAAVETYNTFLRETSPRF